MNAYERGFVDGIKEALRLMAQYDLDYAPGRLAERIKQLSGDEHTSLNPSPPDDHTCCKDP